jgi:hypothetical protein
MAIATADTIRFTNMTGPPCWKNSATLWIIWSLATGSG